MKRDGTAAVAQSLERLVDPGTVAGLSETQVLARFVERGDPLAFEAIVVRYGPMVLSVCRQVLGDANDVDDALQATFVTLIRKAAEDLTALPGHEDFALATHLKFNARQRS
jgi:hypothetical protein